MLIDTPGQQVSTGAMVLTTAFVSWRGGRTDRIGAAMIAAAWLLTPFVEVRRSWYQFQVGIFAIDVATLAGLVVLARLGRRRWPICAAAFQLFAVLTHIAFAINPHALYRAYFYANFSVGYLLLGAMVGGVLIEPRASSRSASAPRPRPADVKRPA